jgi:uncharacterized protein with PIN domain
LRTLHLGARAFIPVAIAGAILFSTAPSTPAAATTATEAQQIVRIARAQYGDPWRYGATGPSAFDCSGLVAYAFTVEAARERVRLTCEEAEIRLVPIAGREFELAVEAYERFGKGRHPASLNMGDCHAYACARAHQAVLLFKGEDFTLTDIVRAGLSG